MVPCILRCIHDARCQISSHKTIASEVPPAPDTKEKALKHHLPLTSVQCFQRFAGGSV